VYNTPSLFGGIIVRHVYNRYPVLGLGIIQVSYNNTSENSGGIIHVDSVKGGKKCLKPLERGVKWPKSPL